MNLKERSRYRSRSDASKDNLSLYNPDPDLLHARRSTRASAVSRTTCRCTARTTLCASHWSWTRCTPRWAEGGSGVRGRSAWVKQGSRQKLAGGSFPSEPGESGLPIGFSFLPVPQCQPLPPSDHASAWISARASQDHRGHTSGGQFRLHSGLPGHSGHGTAGELFGVWSVSASAAECLL